jgi:hypothetical protein
LRVVRKINPDVISSHYILHEHALASKTLPSEIQAMLGVVIQAVILILARALNYLTFKTLCREVWVWTHRTSTAHRRALAVKKKVLTRVFELLRFNWHVSVWKGDVLSFIIPLIWTLYFFGILFKVCLEFYTHWTFHCRVHKCLLWRPKKRSDPSKRSWLSAEERWSLETLQIFLSLMKSLQIQYNQWNQKFVEIVISHLYNLETTIEGITATSLVADIWVRRLYPLSWTRQCYHLAKDKILDLCKMLHKTSDFDRFEFGPQKGKVKII